MKPGLRHGAMILRSTDICHVALLCRTAVYVTRTYGVLGGEPRGPLSRLTAREDMGMSYESWMVFFRWLSYIGLLLVFISTVGTSMFQSRADKTKDQKIDALVSGNKELLAKNDELVTKVSQYQQDLLTKDTRIKDLEVKAKKAGRGITSTYDFNGARRETSAGRSSVIAGEEIGIFQKMVELEKNKAYSELTALCEGQIKKTPTWLTPYLFLGVAYATLGNKDKAISNLEHVVNEAPGDPAYTKAGTILEKIRKR